MGNAIYTGESRRRARILPGPPTSPPLSLKILTRLTVFNEVMTGECRNQGSFAESRSPSLLATTLLPVNTPRAPPPSYTDPVVPNGIDRILQGDRVHDSSPSVHPSFPSSGFPDLTEEVHQFSFLLVYDGPYSRVYRGRRGEQQVAIKAVKYLAGDTLRATRRRVRREMSASHFNHPNILPVYGIMEPNWCEFGCVVTPWCRNGDVSSYILPQNIGIADRYELVSGVAACLEYLHGLSIVHGDIKPGNILVGDDGRALIGDFGLIYYLDAAQGKDNTTTIHNGTTRYLTYELVKYDPPEPRSMASDIHALGCVVCELILLTQPYATRPNNATGHRRIIVDIAEGKPPASQPEMPLDPRLATLWGLLRGCWDKDPARRPIISDVRDTLGLLVDQGS